MQEYPPPDSSGKVRPWVPASPLLSAQNQICTATRRCKCIGESCVFSSAVSLQYTLLFRALRASPEEILVIEGCLG